MNIGDIARASVAVSVVALFAVSTGFAREMADKVYLNAQIWTGIDQPKDAQAMAISGNRIVSLGSDAEIAALAGDQTQIVDLRGGFVLPGFIDNHTHFIDGGLSLSQVDLRDAGTPAEFARRLEAAASRAEEGEWVLGGHWDHELWDGELPRREWVDEATADTPVFVSRYDGHMALANTRTLELAGIDAETPDPAGGTIVRDASGRPTGVLKDAAMELVARVIPDPSEAQLDEALRLAMQRALSRGVTQIHNMGMNPGNWRALDTFRRGHARGELRLRVYAFVPIADWERLDALIAAEGRGDAWLRWGGVKAFVDGSLGSSTAWFYDPYADMPDSSGFMTSSPTVLENSIESAVAAGLHLAVHAIGDRANDWLLDVFEQIARSKPPRDRRFRIEHAQHLSPEAFHRFAELDVIASMQPYHAIDDGRWAEQRIGPERIRRTYAFRSLIDAGVRVTFGSDWPVAPIDPLSGIYAAVTRRTTDGANPEGWVPEQKITVVEAVRAYTRANAYAGFQEQSLGVLAPGYLADFVVLAENIFEIPPGRLAEAEVLRTVIGGRDQYVRHEGREAGLE